MARRPVTHLDVEQSGRSTSAGIARAHLFEVVVGRQKRIDHYIDYFGGGGRRTVVTSDPCGESLLDAEDAR